MDIFSSFHEKLLRRMLVPIVSKLSTWTHVPQINPVQKVKIDAPLSQNNNIELTSKYISPLTYANPTQCKFKLNIAGLLTWGRASDKEDCSTIIKFTGQIIKLKH